MSQRTHCANSVHCTHILMKKPPQQPPVSAVKCMAMSLLHSEPNSCAIFKTNIHLKKSFHLLVLPAAQMESCKAP